MSNAREVPHSESRVPWVDFAKTWSIALVVVMHATVDVGLQIGGTGWLHSVVAFAKPFRMPNFFLVSGLFLGRIVDRPWREFLDKRVLHFVYFYALWLFIELLTKAVHLGIANPPALLATYFWSFVEPFSSMWFIQVLPFFYVAARLVRRLPVPFVLVAAVALHILAAAYPSGSVYALYATMTPSTIVNSFCMFFVYFLAGHLYRDRLFAFAKWATPGPPPSRRLSSSGPWPRRWRCGSAGRIGPASRCFSALRAVWPSLHSRPLWRALAPCVRSLIADAIRWSSISLSMRLWRRRACYWPGPGLSPMWGSPQSSLRLWPSHSRSLSRR